MKNGGCAGREIMSCVPAKPLELGLWYLIMLLLQSMAPSGYSRSPQAPKLWMQQISTCVPAKPLELRCFRYSMLLLQCLAAGLYNTKPLTSKLRNSSCVPAKPLLLLLLLLLNTSTNRSQTQLQVDALQKFKLEVLDVQ